MVEGGGDGGEKVSGITALPDYPTVERWTVRCLRGTENRENRYLDLGPYEETLFH